MAIPANIPNDGDNDEKFNQGKTLTVRFIFFHEQRDG